MTRVVVYGPNIPFDDGAGFHVHAAGCQHSKRLPYRMVVPDSDQGGYVMEAGSVADVVEDIYPSGDFEYDPSDPDEVESYAADITVFPCTGLR
jgi:hypothetical protein